MSKSWKLASTRLWLKLLLEVLVVSFVCSKLIVVCAVLIDLSLMLEFNMIVEFLDFSRFGKTILVINKLRLLVSNPLDRT